MFTPTPSLQQRADASTLNFCKKLNEIGWLFRQVSRLLQKLSPAKQSHPSHSSLTRTCLAQSIHQQLKSFYYFINRLRNTPPIPGANRPSAYRCYQAPIVTMAREHLDKMQLLYTILLKCGGLGSAKVLSLLFLLQQNSYVRDREWLQSMFEHTARGFVSSVNEWVGGGSLVDSGREFFVRIDGDDWLSGVVFVGSGVPFFITHDCAR